MVVSDASGAAKPRVLQQFLAFLALQFSDQHLRNSFSALPGEFKKPHTISWGKAFMKVRSALFSNYDNRRSARALLLHGQEGPIGLFQFERDRCGTDLKFMGELEKIARILPRHVGNAANLPFSP